VFSRENVSTSQSELYSHSLRNTQPSVVEKFHISNLDSSIDESMEDTETQ